MKIITLILFLCILLVGCDNDDLITEEYINNEPAAEEYQSFSGMPAEKWIDLDDLDDDARWEEIWNGTIELELPEFPGVTFALTRAAFVTATDENGEERQLFGGMPILNVFIADVTGDGLPDFAATVAFGSGFVDRHVIVYDFANSQRYVLSDRMVNDYILSLYNGNLIVTQIPFGGGDKAVGQRGELAVIDGQLTMVNY